VENIHTQIRKMLDASREHECDGYGDDHICVRITAFAELPSRFGDFHVVAFTNTRDGKEHAAFVRGAAWCSEDVPVRLHSECLTGNAIGSLRCDCRDQLETAKTDQAHAAWTTPEEIVAAMLYLCSDQAQRVNSARLPLHGEG
jgi:GTP cyclohydrolase II